MKKTLQSPGQKKKKKTKAGSHKASLSKLANKKTNRLAKQGKLNVAEKRKKKRQAQREEGDKKLLQQQQQTAILTEKEENYADESSSNDEETEYFEHMKNAQAFIDTNLNSDSKPQEAKGKKRKRLGDDEEEGEYEQLPRTFKTEKSMENMKMILPIISNGKVIKRMIEKEEESTQNGTGKEELNYSKADDREEQENSDDDCDDVKTNTDAVMKDEKAYLATLNNVQLFAYRKNKLAEKKLKIAALSQGVIEDPENNMKKLKELRLMLGDDDPGVALSSRKYAMVSLMEVFKDIVPGYRLRIPTEKEQTQRVKKETKSLRDYEASFLLSYKIYLDFLETIAKGKPILEKTFLTKHGIKNLNLPPKAAVDLGLLALKCLCEMLVNHPHFNYRNNIIAVLVPFTNHADTQYSRIACEAVKSIFKQDKAGDVTLEIVKTIGRMAKKLKFDIQPLVLETFLVLKIKEVDLSGIAENERKMKRKEKMLKFSRRERKRMKQREQLDKELLETKASVDKQRKLKLHTEIIQAVFETYIRVIKLASDSVVLPAVLEGLARFAHLINVEYFDALFTAFNSLIESGILTTREMLHCMQTAFTILSGQGSVINIDPTSFYKHFYFNLTSVQAGISSPSVPIVIDCLHSMISKRRKQVSQQRILAFIKRLATLCLQQAPEAAVAYMGAIRQFVHTYKYSDILFDNEAQGSGVYLPFLDDPEHCCANSSSLWEFHLLRHHYDPEVRAYTKHMIQKAPVSGEHQLPQQMSRKSPMELYETLYSREIFDKQLPPKCPKKKKLRGLGFLNQEFSDYATLVENELSSIPEDKRRAGPDECMDIS